jgi:hypothetical protein
VFQLPHLEKHEVKKKAVARTMRGRIAFGENARYEDFMRRHYQGWVFRKTLLSENFDYRKFLDEKNEDTVLIAIIDKNGEIKFYPLDESFAPDSGNTIISFGPPKS